MNMRIKSAILSLLLLTTVNLFSQEKSFKIGIKVSPNVSWLKTENGDITLDKAPLKFGYGLVFDRMFATNYAFGTGVNVYSVGGNASYTFGNKVADTTEVTRMSRDYKLSYVEIPLTLKLRTDEIGGLVYWGQFGIGLGYLFKAYGDDKTKVLCDNSNNNMYGDISLSNPPLTDNGNDIQALMNPIRGSMIVSAGVEFPITGNSTRAMAGITYNSGLLSIYRSKDQVAKLTNGLPQIASDKMSFETTSRKIFSNLIELNIGLIF
jgi:Outer membrane protein beta-barrel domain